MTEAKPCLRECVARWVGHYVTYHHAKECRNTGPLVWPKRPGPRASEAPVEEKRCTYCRQSDPPHLDRECNSTRPAPAPEPKQGSEEPIDFAAAENYANIEWWKLHPPATVCDEREGNLSRAFLALRAKLEDEERINDALTAERDALRAEVEESKKVLAAHQSEANELRAELAASDEDLKTMLQAAGEEAERQLATAREEIAKLDTAKAYALDDLVAEKARADRAEERVMELEDLIAAKSEGDSYRDNDGCLPARLKGRSRYEAAQHRTVWIVEILVERKYENRYEATVGCSLTRDGAKELIKVWRANCPSDKFKIAKYRKEGR